MAIASYMCIMFTEPSEDLVIEHLRDFEQLGFDKLQAAISSTRMITDAYLETLASAVNEKKKMEVIITMLSHMVGNQLAVFLEELKSEILQHVGNHKGINIVSSNGKSILVMCDALETLYKCCVVTIAHSIIIHLVL